MQHYIAGIDTGGTCTDGVIMDTDTQEVVATAKVATTHYDLSQGISAVLGKIIKKSGISADQLVATSISTTLATNSVVEKKGARVGLLVIGYVKHFKLPVTAVLYFKGGHTIQGIEEEPLELEYLVETVEKLKAEVDAYAVCSAMSMKNPAHELVAEKAISMIDPKPVFCSHRASEQAGMQERAATAALHAKLMPVMQRFTASVMKSMDALQLSCPLTIVTGNGETIDPEQAVKESGKTIASGPACTALYGAHHRDETCLVIDVGGTTTDLALIEEGQPILSAGGCSIDSWVTHMESVDMQTGGIGGDSLVEFYGDRPMSLGPNRVIPLSMSSQSPSPGVWLGTGQASRCIALARDIPDTAELSNHPILKILQQTGPSTLSLLMQESGLSGFPLDRALEMLNRKQLIKETGFTPTDALHVLDRALFGNKEKAIEGAEKLAGILNISTYELCTRVLEETENRIRDLVIQYIITRSWGNSLSGFLSSHHHNPYIKTDFSLKIPLIGIGAAARYFLPGVATKLSTTISFPPFSAVGNAVGAGLAGLSRMETVKGYLS